MKNVLMSVGLILALICVNQIWAQDEVEQKVEQTSKVVVVSDTEAEADDKQRISIELSLDDDKQEMDEESVERLTDLVRDVAGEEAAEEVLIELQGLSKEEKAELAEALRDGLDFAHNQVPGWVGIVAVLAVILIFGFPILMLIAIFVYLARKRRQKMSVIQLYLDAGKEVPQELLVTLDNGGGSFRSGLMLSAIGLGIVAAFNAANEPSVGALGLIPLFIGFAKLLYWYVEERKQNQG